MEKSPQIHHKAAVTTKRLRVQGLGERVSMLQCRRYVDKLELSVSNTFPKEVMTAFESMCLLLGVVTEFFCQRDRPLDSFLHRGTPNIAVRENKLQINRMKIVSRKPVAIATYSACIDESVMDF